MKIFVVFLLFISCLSMQFTSGQQTGKKIKITGSVVDSNRKPIANAIIMVDHVKTDIATNENGIYIVKVASNAKTISAFSLLSGVSEVEINGQTTVNIVLGGAPTPTSEQLQDADEPVDIGYGTVQKDQALNSVDKFDGKGKPSRGYTSIFDMISNEVSGVQVSGTSVKVRQGPMSVYLNEEPLYIVDGSTVMQIENINPSDVVSIELLKGAAASIYGISGANGVLVITTKK